MKKNSSVFVNYAAHRTVGLTVYSELRGSEIVRDALFTVEENPEIS